MNIHTMYIQFGIKETMISWKHDFIHPFVWWQIIRSINLSGLMVQISSQLYKKNEKCYQH